MPYEPLQVFINRSGSTTGDRFVTVTIVDEDGVTYRFGEGRYLDANEDDWVTTWHLTTVISADRQDTVKIGYERGLQQTLKRVRSLVVSDDLEILSGDFTYNEDNPPCQPYTSPLYELAGTTLTSPLNDGFFSLDDTEVHISDISPYYISSIRFGRGGSSGGTVDFTYGPESSGSGSLSCLKKMSVEDGWGNSVKTINFAYKDNLSGNLKLLDRVEFTAGSDQSKKETYSFDYYDTSWAPSCLDLSLNSDWWGFYSRNAGWFQAVTGFDIYVAVANSASFPGRFVKRDIPGGNKEPDLESLKIGMIRKITFPTGGSMEFEYERNEGGSGLRILKQTATSGEGNTVQRYKYEQAHAFPYSLAIRPPGQNFYFENEIECLGKQLYCYYLNPEGGGRYRQRVFQNSHPSQYTDIYSTVTSYGKVTEYTDTANIGKIVYTYSNRGITSIDYNSIPENGFILSHLDPKDFWKANHLRSKTVYDNQGRKVKEYSYSYGEYWKESVFDLPVYRYRKHLISLEIGHSVYGGDPDKAEITLIHHLGGCSDCLRQSFTYLHQEYTIGAERLSKVTEDTYSPDGTKVSVVKEYTYDPNYLLPVEEKVTNSDDKVTRTTYRYPFDYTTLPYTTMVSEHRLSPVVEQQRYVGDTWIQTMKNDYKEWKRHLFSPEYVKLSTPMHSAVENLATYHSYDFHGKPRFISRNETGKTVYLWGYNGQYLIAQIQLSGNYTFEAVESAVKSVFSVSSLDELSQESLPDESILTNGSLQNALPNALVTTYTYKPLVGMVTMTDPRGVVTNYDYDSFGRLQKLRQGGKAKQEYEYNYVR